ncbi:hypothetical protein niasHT_000470 [Heterodera trifolii]|uniref:Uncharacterized protein n=1 Tax=Heterodera trifolii TaxID=157864 RepID=A0ABD2LYV9_9BILA
MKRLISFLLLFIIVSTNGTKLSNELNVVQSEIINNLKNSLESDGLVLFGGDGWMANTRKYAEWAHALVCSNKNVIIGSLNNFIGQFCAGVVDKDWKNAKTKLIKAFGGQMALFQTLTDNGQNTLTKLKRDEETASEKHKVSVSQAIRESLKQIAAKMPLKINLETFYEQNKLG